MNATRLVCRSCGAEYPLGQFYHCVKCDGILEVHYDYARAFRANPIANPDVSKPGIWKYADLLPIRDAANMVSLGEGDTPLIPVPRLADLWRCGVDLRIKAESLNPSGSFKDRPTAVGVAAAKENGFDRVVLSSSGNASASAAAYAARAGMDCVVFVPEATDPNKVAQAQAYGARVFKVKGGFPNSYAAALECAQKHGMANVTSTFLYPYTMEGDKTPAYELYAQMRGRTPDYILVPISAGPLLVGIFKGFEEMHAAGLVRRLPAMIGVQARACEPITRAFENGDEKVAIWREKVETSAGGISDPLVGYPEDGTLTLRTIRRSNGMAVSLDEAEILEALAAVEKKVGLYCEPSGAIAAGAVRKLWDQGRLAQDSVAVAVVTGHGFKFSGRSAEPPIQLEDLGDLASKL